MKDYLLTSSLTLAKIFKEKGVRTWLEALDYIANLPYGRNISKTNLSSVLVENKGTCSTKHALLKELSAENEVPNIKLMLCLFKMNGKNTKGIKNILSTYNLSYIPEAHCYLNIEDEKKDYTFSNSTLLIENDIIEEMEITPHQITEFKNFYHKNHLSKWLKEENIPFSIEKLWNIREECIIKLSGG